MQEKKQSQIFRILSLYDRFMNGQLIVKKDEASRFTVSEKSIQRDIDNIRDFIEVDKPGHYVEFNRSHNAYMLEGVDTHWLKKGEVFAILKVLIQSRAFSKEEMDNITEKLTKLAHKDHRPFIER